MSQTQKIASSSSPAERILNVASELFYTQGYRATGINEVIQKSGVAKATFYSHFPSKEDLALAYLQLRKAHELIYIDNAIAQAKGPRDRFFAVMHSLGPWLKETDFRGCVFLNIASEVPDHTSALRKEGGKLYTTIRSRVEALSRELVASAPDKYGHLDPQRLSRDYMVLFTGSLALCEIYHEIWPFEHGVQALRGLIGEKRE